MPFNNLHHLTLSFIPATIPGAVASTTGLLMFAAAGPLSGHMTQAEDVTLSIAKVVGIVVAVAAGSWTTSRKLKSIEDSITAAISSSTLLKQQVNRIEKDMRALTCYNAPSCDKRRGPKGATKRKKGTK